MRTEGWRRGGPATPLGFRPEGIIICMGGEHCFMEVSSSARESMLKEAHTEPTVMAQEKIAVLLLLAQ